MVQSMRSCAISIAIVYKYMFMLILSNSIQTFVTSNSDSSIQYKVYELKKIAKLQHPCMLDSNPWLVANPLVSIEDNINDADILVYQAECDKNEISIDINHFLSAYPTKLIIFIISSDQVNVPSNCANPDKSLFFATNKNKGSNCRQTQIPYYRNLNGGILPNMKILHELKNNEGPHLNNRQYICSFLGSSWTYQPRNMLSYLNKYADVKVEFNDKFWRDNNYRNPDYTKTVQVKSNQLLLSSIFTLSPRGNGISSMRLIESIMLGSIPILMNDEMKPFENNMTSFAIRWDFIEGNNDAHLDSLYTYLTALSKDTREMKKRYRSMYKFIINELVIDLKRLKEPESESIKALPFSDLIWSSVNEIQHQ
jgi:Exostosin family